MTNDTSVSGAALASLSDGALISVVTQIVMALQLALALPGQAFVTGCVACIPSFRRPTYYLLVNQMVAGFVNLFQWSVLNNIYMHLTKNDGACHSAAILAHVSEGVLIMNIGVLSLNRWVALCKPAILKDIFSFRKTMLIIGAMWLVSGLLSAGVIFKPAGASVYGTAHVCMPDIAGLKGWQSWMSFICGVFGVFGVSYPTAIWCNLKIRRKLIDDKAKIASSMVAAADKIKSFAEIQRMLIIYCLLPQALTAPLVVAIFIPGIETYPGVGRAGAAIMFTIPVFEPYVCIICMKPFRVQATKTWASFNSALRLNRVTPQDPCSFGH